MNIIKFLKTKYIDMVDEIELNSLKGKVIIYVNPMNYSYLRKNSKLLDRFCSFIFTKNKSTRRQSFDFKGFANELFTYAANNKLKIFVAGGTEKENIVFQKKIKSYYPDIEV